MKVYCSVLLPLWPFQKDAAEAGSSSDGGRSNINGGKIAASDADGLGGHVEAEKVQAEENNELLAQNLNRRRQQLFRQEMGSRLKSKINATAASLLAFAAFKGHRRRRRRNVSRTTMSRRRRNEAILTAAGGARRMDVRTGGPIFFLSVYFYF